MIHRAKFQNFKALRDVEITFDRRLTVLVGPNGSGKTSVLRGLKWVCDVAGGGTPFTHALQEMGQLLRQTHSGGQGHQLIEAAETGASEEQGYRVRLPHNSAQPSVEPFVGGAAIQSKVLAPVVSFTPAELIQLRPASLATPTLTTATPPVLGRDGTGLASLMSYFNNEDKPKFEQAVGHLRKIVDRVQTVHITRVRAGGGDSLGEGLLFDLPDRKGVPASAMSDGTLYALGLIVKILDPQRPKTLLIDDIDHGFHPKAQLTLVELLHKLLEEIPDLQIIATSHSPYILSGLEWDEVRVTGLKEDGSAVIQPLTAHPNYEKWKESMTPGEFWSHAGEDWVLNVREREEALAR